MRHVNIVKVQMSKKYKVSVIVPVYNVEKYVEKCLESLVCQTLDSLQIIVVNDGSTDNSQSIIDKYTALYPDKVFGYKKENGGLGDARNYAMQFADGEYISFVDSDDWVDEKMFDNMYNFANKNNYQIVLCDMYCVNDGWELGSVAKEYRGDDSCPTIRDYVLNCLNPAHACGKLYYYQLLEIQKFPKIWYEDMATIPIIMSYAESIGYLQIPFYYYRQREGSITQNKLDVRTLQVMEAWDNIIKNINKLYTKEVIAAVYQSVDAFIYFKPQYSEYFIQYVRERKDIFLNNKYVQEWIVSKTHENIMEKELIPKKLHYFWFGPAEKNDLFYKCYESWKKFAPGFEIIEWNESNCDVNVCEYVKEAYEAKKWAFVSDYFRIKILYEFGGVYVDTDTELMDSIWPLIVHNAFFAFETKKQIHAGIFGTVPHNKLMETWLNTYEGDHLLNENGSLDTANTIVKRLTKILVENYGACLNGKKQNLKSGIVLYQPNELTLDMYDGRCIAQHHYEASWWDVKVGNTSYKHEVLRDYFNAEIGAISNDEVSLLRWQLAELKNSTSWKITKPIRLFFDLIKKVF